MAQQQQDNQSVITALRNSNPMTITLASATLGGVQTFNSGDLVTFNAGATGISELDGNTFTALVSGNVLTFQGIDATVFPAATLTGGSILTCNTTVITAIEHGVSSGYDETYIGGINLGTQFNAANAFNVQPLPLSWSVAPGGGSYSYNIYKKAQNGLWGFMGNTSGTSFTDDGTVQPNTSEGPPVYQNNFIGVNGNPSVIGVYQQRLMLANTPSQQDHVFASNVGNFSDFTTTSPVPVSSDSVNFKVVGQQYNEVSQIIDNGFLLLFTQTGEFSCYGAGTSYAAGPITPTQIGLVQQAFYGATPLLQPITIGKNVIYVQTLESKIRELLYNYYINGYSGTDLTIDSQHLFDGYTFVSWAYQQEPNSIIWLVRSDGALLSLTYLPEIQLKAWTRHDTTGGLFEQVISIPEGSEFALYCVVNRGGFRYIERFASRNIPMIPTQKYINSGENEGIVKTYQAPDPTAFVFMDCSSYYDGRSINQVANMSVEAGDYTAQGNGFSMVCNQAVFNIGMIGNTAVMLTDPLTGTVYRCSIIGFVSSTHVTCRPDVTLPTSFTFAQFLSYALGKNVVSGLAQFPDGTKVSILADGSVLSSYATESFLTVESGSVTLDNYYAYIRVGLPYFSDMWALDIDTTQPGMTAQDKPQLVERMGVYVDQTRGLWAGSRPPSDDAVDPLENLAPFAPRHNETMGIPPEARTGVEIIPVAPEWAYGGGAFIRQPDPLPMTVESIIPAGKFMVNGG